jgi:cytochrome b6-f complex iron-sulfur subunit
MSTGATIAIGAVIVFLLLVVFLATTSSRRDRADAVGVLSRETRKRDRSNDALERVVPAEAPAPATGRDIERAAVLERTGGGAVVVRPRSAPPATRGPIDPETYGQTRRQFLNRGIVGFMVVGLSGFGAAVIAFLWPPPAAGFGGKITAGTIADVKKTLDTKTPFYNPQGRFYINPYPNDPGTIALAKKVYSDAIVSGMQAGYVALYQKCVHLGCRVPWCQTSQWFECPCHGSKYNRVGEKKGGPAPRGLDRFALSVSGGNIVVDTKTIYQGPPIGTNTSGQGQDGPHCSG